MAEKREKLLWKNLGLIALGGVAASLIVAETYRQNQAKVIPISDPSSIPFAELCISSPDSLALLGEKEGSSTFQRGVIINKVAGLDISFFTSVANKVVSDPEVGLRTDQSHMLTFLVPHNLQTEEDSQSVSTYVMQQNLRYYIHRHCFEWAPGHGEYYGRAISVTDLLKGIHQRYPDQRNTPGFYELALSIDLSYAWTIQNIKQERQLYGSEVLDHQFTPRQRVTVLSPLPIVVNSISHEVLQTAGIPVSVNDG